jgi:Mg-chelatase subunit ChlI
VITIDGTIPAAVRSFVNYQEAYSVVDSPIYTYMDRGGRRSVPTDELVEHYRHRISHSSFYSMQETGRKLKRLFRKHGRSTSESDERESSLPTSASVQTEPPSQNTEQVASVAFKSLEAQESEAYTQRELEASEV